jgi:hypothetical protein
MIFTIPYRWTWKTILKNIGWIWYSIHRGIANIISWIPIIWFDEDFDWDPLARIMEFKLRRMSESLKRNQQLKQSTQTLICAEILKRLIRDDENLEKEMSFKKHCIRMDEWQKELGRQIGKHFMSWWD